MEQWLRQGMPPNVRRDPEQALAEDEQPEADHPLLDALQEAIGRLEETQKQTLRAWLQKSTATAFTINYTQTQAEIARLEGQHEQTLQEWIEARQKQLTLFRSPFVSPKAVLDALPTECTAHPQEAKARLKQEGHNKEAWFHHVFECEACCAPLLQDITDIHTQHVIDLPHTIVLFELDTYTVQDKYQKRLDALMQNFDAAHDQLLLIGRASKIGDRAYNIVLSGQRAGEIKDYFIEKFAVEDTQIRYLYFGYDPPQLTLEHAKRYGVTAGELAAIDAEGKTKAENKINQSVVIVVYKAKTKDS